MANLNSEVSKKANSQAAQFKGNVMSSEHQPESIAQSVGQRVENMASSIADTTVDSLNYSRKFVKENPIKGVAIAAASGLILGSLFTISMRGQKN